MAVVRRMLVAWVAAALGASAVPAATYATGAAADTVTVRGVVLGHDGEPVQGATIELVESADVDGCPELDHGQFPVVLATTGADGGFSLTCTASFLWIQAKLPSGEFAGWKTFGTGVNDVTFRAYAKRGSIEGTVYDQYGAPATDAEIMFVWDLPGAGAYDYRRVDAAAHYRVDDLYPGVRYTVVAFLDGAAMVGEYVFTATEATITHDLLVHRPVTADRERPRGAFTGRSGRHHRLKASGWAHDDVAVAKVMVAIRNQRTGKWLRLNGSWGRYQLRPARMTAPGADRTGWWVKKWLRVGRYGVSVVVVDEAGHHNPAPRPWRVVRVRR
jgi:hypothetical protein